MDFYQRLAKEEKVLTKTQTCQSVTLRGGKVQRETQGRERGGRQRSQGGKGRETLD
jgi:hypothetical protein